jgi:uncharacterized protein (DUF1778 family)
MAKTTDRFTTRDQLNVRVSRAQRDLIDHAAASLGKTRTDFILESAVREAQQVLLDQVFFSLDEDAFKQVAALLDHPPAPSAALRDLLSARAPWE